jgi:hypothetical protein
MIPGFLALQGPEFFLPKLLPHFSAKLIAGSGNVYRGRPLVGVARKILVAGTKFSEKSMAGPLGGAVSSSGGGHHQSWRH